MPVQRQELQILVKALSDPSVGRMAQQVVVSVKQIQQGLQNTQRTAQNTQNVFLRCPSCRKKLFTYIELDDLEEYSADEIEEYLAMYKPFLNTLVAIVGLVFFWLPFFGFIWSGLAVLANWRRDDWVRIVSIIGFVLSTIVTVLMLIHMITGA